MLTGRAPTKMTRPVDSMTAKAMGHGVSGVDSDFVDAVSVLVIPRSDRAKILRHFWTDTFSG